MQTLSSSRFQEWSIQNQRVREIDLLLRVIYETLNLQTAVEIPSGVEHLVAKCRDAAEHPHKYCSTVDFQIHVCRRNIFRVIQ